MPQGGKKIKNNFMSDDEDKNIQFQLWFFGKPKQIPITRFPKHLSDGLGNFCATKKQNGKIIQVILKIVNRTIEQT